MKISKLEVLDAQEIKIIHQHSLEVLAEVGIKVELKKMRQLLADLGCDVNETEKRVKFKPDFVAEYVKRLPGSSFSAARIRVCSGKSILRPRSSAGWAP